MQQAQEGNRQNSEPEVLDVSRRLARSIGESAPFRRYEKTTEGMQADPKAQGLLSEFEEARSALRMKQGWGGASDEESNRVMELQKRLLSNPTIRDHFQAQEDLVRMLKELNASISEKLGFDFANLTKPSGGCC